MVINSIMIYFVRHGRTDDNENKIVSGQKNVPLNEHGLAQALETAEYLKDIKFAACYCSPLMRARQTCAAVMQYHKHLKPIYDDRLKARYYGKVEGQPETAITFNRWQVGAFDRETAELELETIEDLYNRVADLLDEILKKYPKKNVLVIGHSCIGRVAAGYFNGIPENQDFSALKVSNAKVVMFDK